jgi:hypothetical protein
MNVRSNIPALLVLLAGLIVPGVAAALPFEVLRSGLSSDALSPIAARTDIVRSEEELDALWRSLGRRSSFRPVVDFRRQTLVVCFLGMRPTGGYSVQGEDVQVRAGTLTVSLVETTPGACCVTTFSAVVPEIWIVTSPWQGPIDVEVRRVERNCCP